MATKGNLSVSNTFSKGSHLMLASVKKQLEEARILNQELLEKLKNNRSAITSMGIEDIIPNDNQPRKSFYVVDGKAKSMACDGQKTPIVLAQIPGQSKAVIFDGECRFRAAKQLGWKTIQAIFIPYSAETFDRDVLTSAIQDNGLNNLDLAEALIKRIVSFLPELNADAIVTSANTFITRLKRNQQIELIKGLHKQDFNLQEEVLGKIELSPTEKIIATTILGYQLNLVTTSLITLPYLRLPDDIKQSIRANGLGDTNAKIIGTIRINNSKIKIDHQTAYQLRQKLCSLCIVKGWTKNQAQQQVKDAIAPYLINKPQLGSSKQVQKYIQSLAKFDLESVPRNALFEIEKAMLAKLAQIELAKKKDGQ